jgi:solute carrier family 35 protein F1/2
MFNVADSSNHIELDEDPVEKEDQQYRHNGSLVDHQGQSNACLQQTNSRTFDTGSPQDATYDISPDSVVERQNENANDRGQGERWSTMKLIIFGQILSISITGTATFSQFLSNNGVNAPTFQSFTNYVMLCVYIFPLYQSAKVRKDHNSNTNIKTNTCRDSASGQACNLLSISTSLPSWQYFLLALADVEGNFFLVRAYQYTTITSVQLLDCFTIPCVMVLSVCLFSTTFKKWHIIGCVSCLIGLVLCVISDIVSDRYGDQQASNAYIGDLLVCVGCVFYAVSNIGQEIVVKEHDARVEYLAMLGLYGTFISGVQMLIFERDAIAAIDFTNASNIANIFLFDLCLFSLYSGVPYLLHHSSAVFMNLSFLTSDFFSVIIALFVFGARLHPLYIFSFIVIVVGLIIYNLAEVDQHHPLLHYLEKYLCCSQSYEELQGGKDEEAESETES